MRTIRINKDKNIGKVLIIVEGLKTEFYLLHKIFTQIFDFQYEKLDRLNKYKKYNMKEGIPSSVFVINTEESALSYIDDSNDFLNNLFEKLIEFYEFPVDRAAIFYLFDRDVKSNTNLELISNLIDSLNNSRENNGFTRQGLFLLSYPCVESFVASNFIENTISLHFETGEMLKKYLDNNKINQSQISESSLLRAVDEMERGIFQITASKYDLDNFSICNQLLFNLQEEFYRENHSYKLLSLLSIILLDLGIIQVEEG